MTNEMTTVTVNDALERVIAQGDLGKLTLEQRTAYYQAVCESLGLNPLTRPFEYIMLQGRLTLYARRDAADQLRKLHGISVEIASRVKVDDLYVVTARATDRSGRVDESIGAVAIGALKGEALANALMKCETKAKRRVTLSICGLGWTDETEVETIPQAQLVEVDQDDMIGDEPPLDEPQPHWIDDDKVRARFWAWTGDLGLTNEEVYEALGVEHVHDYTGTKDDARAAIEGYIEAHSAQAQEA